jgi:putative MATE family efflux protein
MGPLLLKMSLPATVGMFVNALYNVVDAIFIGRGAGALAIGGLTIAFPLQIFVFGIALMVGTGAASIVSRALGADDETRAQQAAGTAASLGVAGGLLLTIGGLSFLEPILAAFGATPALMPHARGYLEVVLFGAPFIVLAVAGNNLIRAEGRPVYAMTAMLIGAVSNIILDAVFIFGMDMGIRGAALATVIGRFLSFAFISFYFASGRSSLNLRLPAMVPLIGVVPAILALGTPALVRQIGGSVLAITVNNALRIHGSDLHIAAFGIINRILIFGLMPIFGIVQGFQPIAGFNYGARNFHRVRRSVHVAAGTAFSFAVVFFAVVMVFPRQLLSVFSPNQELLAIGVPALRTVAVAVPLVGLQAVGATFFLAIGKAIPSLALSMSRQIIFLIPLVITLPVWFSLSGVWAAFPTADVLATALTVTLLLLELARLKRAGSAEAAAD